MSSISLKIIDSTFFIRGKALILSVFLGFCILFFISMSPVRADDALNSSCQILFNGLHENITLYNQDYFDIYFNSTPYQLDYQLDWYFNDSFNSTSCCYGGTFNWSIEVYNYAPFTMSMFKYDQFSMENDTYYSWMLNLSTEGNDTFGGCWDALVINNIPYLPQIVSSCADITESGLWTVDGDLTLGVNGSSCIDIQASDVVLDCQGHTLNSTVENGTAIFVDGFDNVTIRNCVFAPYWADGLIVYGFMYDVSLVDSNVTVLTNNSFNSTFIAKHIYVSGVDAYDFNGNYWGKLYHDGYSDLCSADNGYCTNSYNIFGDSSYYDYTPLSNNQLQVAQGEMGVLLTTFGQGMAGFIGGIQDPVTNLLLLLGIVTAFATVFFLAIAMAVRNAMKQ